MSVPGPTLPDEASLLERGARYERARKFANAGVFLFIYGLAAVWIFLNLTGRLAQFAGEMSDNVGLAAIVVALPLTLICLMFFLAIQAGQYFVDRRYGLTPARFGYWLGEMTKAMAVGGLFVFLWIEIVAVTMARFPRSWWLYLWCVQLVSKLFVAYVFPAWILPLLHRSEPLAAGSLLARLRTLEQRAGVRIKDYAVVHIGTKTHKANAWAAGVFGRYHVLLADTLLNNYTEDEVEAVVAHEFGHIQHSDLGKRIAFLATVEFLLLPLVALLMDFVFEYGFRLRLLPLACMFALIPILFARGLLLTLSRRQERAADRFAWQFSSLEAFISAMRKLQTQNLITYSRKAAANRTHPAMEERIEAATRLLAERNHAIASSPKA
jgi:STE24 endopeptidase